MPSTLLTIMKSKQGVFNSLEENFSRKQKRDRGSKYLEAEAALLEWLKNIRGANLPVYGPAFTAKGWDASTVIWHE